MCGFVSNPPEQGSRVQVKGDGWGGPGPGFFGTVIEADDHTFTVIDENLWRETHVLRKYCTLRKRPRVAETQMKQGKVGVLKTRKPTTAGKVIALKARKPTTEGKKVALKTLKRTEKKVVRVKALKTVGKVVKAALKTAGKAVKTTRGAVGKTKRSTPLRVKGKVKSRGGSAKRWEEPSAQLLCST